jgi:Spy/CpxP family protein refolding chaperone
MAMSGKRWLRLALALVLCTLVTQVNAQEAKPDKEKADKKEKVDKKAEPAKPPAPKLGLSVNDPRAFQGYSLIAPLTGTTTYLLDMQGKVVRSWESDCSPALMAYLLPNGHLLRPGSLGSDAQVFGPGPGVGGRVQEFTWDGELVWDFRLVNARQLPHHDITPMPNGNILMIVNDRKTAKETLAAGRRPELTGDSHFLPDSILEIKPTGKTTGEIVWEWHLWDHLVQDFDKSKANYGNVAEHPELVNLNYGEDALAPIAATKDGAEKLKSIGYVGTNTGGRRGNPDWTHCNGVSYNPDLDQISISVHGFSEFWIIDHSTSKAEAAGHRGGKSDKGGDLLYRWGNPRAYRAGTKADQKLFAQHNAHWIPKGLPGAGHILVFNNGSGRPDGTYSSVDEIVLPVDGQGRYEYKAGVAFGPDKPVWSYTAPKKTDFYSFFISGAQRLPNGNTFICSGANGITFEVTPEKEIVWQYINPVKGGMGSPGGFATPSPPGTVMPRTVRDILDMSPDQRQQLDDVQKDVDSQLDKLFTADQKQKLKDKPQIQLSGMGFSPNPPPSGKLISGSEITRLKFSDDQKKQLDALQKEVDGKLDKIMTPAQKSQFKSPNAFQVGGPPPGSPGGGGPGGPPKPGQLVPTFLQDGLKLTADQKKQLADLQKDIDAKLDKTLTPEQQKQFKEPQGFGALPQPGQLMSPTIQARLKLTAEQKKEVEELQKDADAKLTKLFTDEQNKQFKEMRQGFGRGGPGGFAGGPPGGPGRGPGGPPGMPTVPPGGSSLFRAYRYGVDYSGLAGKDLKPGKTIEEQLAKEPAGK